MTLNERLIRKGKDEPRGGLVDQARVTVTLATTYAAALATTGWSAGETAKLVADATSLESDISVMTEKRSASKQSLLAEHIAIDDTKALIRKVRNALPRALRLVPAGKPTVALEAFQRGSLPRSAPKLSLYLTEIRPHVAVLDTELSPAFGGVSALESLDAVKKKLDEAQSHQEAGVAALPLDTQKLYETKGRVLEAIEDCNRAGKMAFDGDALRVALWNKDVLKRARTTRLVEPEPTPEPKPT